MLQASASRNGSDIQARRDAAGNNFDRLIASNELEEPSFKVVTSGARGASWRPAARRQCSANRHTEWTGTQCVHGEKTIAMLFESPNAKLFPAFNIPPPVRLR
ncbi:hypothetical protein RR48_15108 [Papilio machaon]|uniref:Uncharacterized protein n=1 Tax=Papilio machaon TaxID=76193 RepID=A0A194QU19_PAPMA|nr:hypothetical protein RR48_15108 [Papilio machaon]